MESTTFELCADHGRTEVLPKAFLAAFAGRINPVRRYGSYKGQRSKPGFYFFEKTGELLHFESRFEGVHMKLADFHPGVLRIVPQPFRIHFARREKPFRHVVDIGGWRHDAKPFALDVKGALEATNPENLLVFELTAEACAEAGIDYFVATEPDETMLANLNWLSGFRRPQAHVAMVAEVSTEALERASTPLSALVAMVSQSADLHPAEVRPALFHLLWHKRLGVDLTQCLTDLSSIEPAHRWADLTAALVPSLAWRSLNTARGPQ